MGQYRSQWRQADTWFRIGVSAMAVILLLTAAGLVVLLAVQSMHSFREFGIGFFAGRQWDPVNNEFGALPFVYGTVVTSLIGLILVLFVGVGSAIFLTHISRDGCLGGRLYH
ncbi:MAG: hypothetical protein QJR01_10040 [Kyrpidia sp.]|nr:hypothetical protein [Kyrpidia sp.]